MPTTLQAEAAKPNPLSFSESAKRVASTWRLGGRDEALDHATALERNIGWDAVKLMAAADEIYGREFAARNNRVDPEA